MKQEINFSPALSLTKAVSAFIFVLMMIAGLKATACTITISASATTICTGASITFTGTIAGASNQTTFQWKKNGVAMTGASNNGFITSPGNGSFTYTASGFSNGDIVTCYITEPAASFSTTSSGITITVHALPASITGSSMVSAGGSVTLSDAASGGVWTSSNTAKATIGSGSGIVTGVAAGSCTVSYSVTGCYAVAPMSVISIASISGNTSICAGASTTLSDATAGGTWVSGNTSVATVGSATGIVSGVVAGTATISYLAAGGKVTSVITVKALPAGITGTTTVGIGGSVTLYDVTTGGTWSSSNIAIATICASCGEATGISAGTCMITYNVGTGCNGYTPLHVISLSPIAGASSICVGSTFNFTDATSGGVWSSSNTSVATVGSSTGMVTGLRAGVATITYYVYGTPVTYSITVNAIPAAITGAVSTGLGGTTTLSDASSGGAWTSSRTAVATIVSGSGLVTGVSAGSTIITYNVSGCSVTRAFTVLPVSAIAGTTTICAGTATTLTDATSGGTWSSSNTSVATVGSATGVVTGVAGGNVTISYNKSGNIVTTVVTINAAPTVGAISGFTTVIPGGSITLSDFSSGSPSSWSSSNTAVATIGSTGVVTGVAGGTTVISFTSANSCGSGVATFVVTVPATTGSVCTPMMSTLAGNGTSGYSGDGGYATSAELNNPYGVAADGSGNIFIADKGNNCIRKVNAAGIMSTIAGNGTAGYTGDNGAATAAKLNSPSGVACDAAGNVYIADQVNNCIRKVTTAGIISTFAGNGTAGYTGDGAAATAAELNQPINVATDMTGNVYIVDFDNSAIRKVNNAGIIITVAGNGTPGFSGDGGAATAAKLYRPTMMACDASGNLYIDDENNDRIRKVSAAGIITTFAGTGTDGYTGDGGAATAAELNETYGVCTDACGNVYIADLVNERIRIVNTSGIISTYCGTGVRGADGDGGAATAAQLYNPYGICTDGAGNLYIADNIDQKIRKVSACSLCLAPISGASIVCSGATTTYTDAATGGTWSSSNTSIATINASGVVTGVAAGTVFITYTDGGSSVVTLTVMPSPSVTGIVSNPTCNGYTNGSIDITATGGSTSGTWLYYTYTWNTGATSDGAWGLGAGSYSVIATDPNGCSGSAAFTLSQPAAMAGSASITDVTSFGCSTGEIDYTVAGGNGIYSYLWNNGDTSKDITSIPAGDYYVTATDTNGCNVTNYFTVNQPSGGRHSAPAAQNAGVTAENGVQAYPNPFSTRATISFTMPTDGATTVDVYNAINGGHVATIFNEDTHSGTTYSAVLDGTSLNAGIYIYTVSCGNETYTGKVALVK